MSKEGYCWDRHRLSLGHRWIERKSHCRGSSRRLWIYGFKRPPVERYTVELSTTPTPSLLSYDHKHGKPCSPLPERRGRADVVTALLYGFLDEVIYVKQPTGIEGTGSEHLVCLLDKALYGLKQSPRAWFQTLRDFLMKLKFIQSDYDHRVFINHSMAIAVYVGGILIFGADEGKMKRAQDSLAKRFKMTDLGEVYHYL